MAFSLKFFFISLVMFLTITTCVKSSFLIPAIFVFGDSLADVGNNNNLTVPLQDRSNYGNYGIDLPPGIPIGRFTNGLNAIDFAASYLGFPRGPPAYLTIKNDVNQMLQGVNFASAGSGILDSTGPGTLNMATQIKYFEKAIEDLKKKLGEETAKKLISRSMFMIITGSNDMFEYYRKTGAKNKDSNSKFVSYLVDSFIQHLMALTKLGVKNFYISGLGPLGCVPAFRSQTKTGECLEGLNDLAKDYNFIAKNRLNILFLSRPGLMRYAFVDAYGISETMMATHWLYGITEVQDACCGGGRFNGEKGCNGNATVCSNRSNYFFWDQYHPTEKSAKIASTLAVFGPTIFTSPFNLLQLATGL